MACFSIVSHTAAGAGAEQGERTLAVVYAERPNHVSRQNPHSGVDQPDIAPRAAEADLDRLEGCDFRARLGKPQRRRKTGVAAADHDDVGPDVADQRLGRRGGRRRLFPQAVREGVVAHRGSNPRVARMIGAAPGLRQFAPRDRAEL